MAKKKDKKTKFTKIKSRKELKKYLKKQDFTTKNKFSSVYFMIKTDKEKFPVYFTKYKKYYFENDCSVHFLPCSLKELKEYVKETYYKKDRKSALKYEKSMYRNGRRYEINAWQTAKSLLPDKFKIKKIDEQEVLDWYIKNTEKFLAKIIHQGKINENCKK